mgnify:CR=1 FL=1
MTKKLNIVSFNVPYPPDFGGAIDVFYKLKSLSEAGVQIDLHLFEYGRGRPSELEKYCDKVFYYKRDRSFFKGIQLTPYIVASRKNKELIKNLNASAAPVLFEGVHTTAPLKGKALKSEVTLVRMHNLEHDYYNGLFRSEPNVLKKLFYWVEAKRLKRYQKNLNAARMILSISPSDQSYFEKNLSAESTFVPAFHHNNKVRHLKKKGYFALFHGDLSVWDNRKAAHFLVGIFGKLDIPLIIAGRTEDKKLLEKIELAKNLKFISLQNQEQLDDLLQRAHINIFWSSNASGIKIKLLNALFNGRFCLVNNPVVEGSGLEDLCEVVDDEKSLVYKAIQLMDVEFSDEQYFHRKEKMTAYDNKQNTKRLLEILNF